MVMRGIEPVACKPPENKAGSELSSIMEFVI